MNEQAKAEFDRLADAVERFQRILAASGNAPEIERRLMARLVGLMFSWMTPVNLVNAASIIDAELDWYLGARGKGDGEA